MNNSSIKYVTAPNIIKGDKIVTDIGEIIQGWSVTIHPILHFFLSENQRLAIL